MNVSAHLVDTRHDHDAQWLQRIHYWCRHQVSLLEHVHAECGETDENVENIRQVWLDEVAKLLEYHLNGAHHAVKQIQTQV